MSLDRYKLSSLYNTAVTTRLQDKYLLNEVKFSNTNVQKFIEKYGKKTVHVDLGPAPGKRNVDMYKDFYYKYINLFKKYGANDVADNRSKTAFASVEHWPAAAKKELPHPEKDKKMLDAQPEIERNQVDPFEMDRDNPEHIERIKLYCFQRAFSIFKQVRKANTLYKKYFESDDESEPTKEEEEEQRRLIDKLIVRSEPYQEINVFPPEPRSYHERRNYTDGNYSKKENEVREQLMMYILSHEISFVSTQRPGITLNTTLKKDRVTFPGIHFIISGFDPRMPSSLGYARTDAEIAEAWHMWLFNPGMRTLDMYKDDPSRTYVIKTQIPDSIKPHLLKTQSGRNMFGKQTNPTLDSNNFDFLFTTVAPGMNTQRLLMTLLEQSGLFGFDEKFSIANTYLSRKVEDIRGNKGSYSGSWIVHDPEGNTKDRKRDVTFFVADFDYWYILIFHMFNVKQQYLPIKDIFGYRTLNDLLRALIESKSQRQKKRGIAMPADLDRCTIYKDSNVLVVKPDSWDVSHKYFGKYRTSLFSGRTIEGSHWCTAASTNIHWNRYVNTLGNNMYYFMDLHTEELWAIRTLGKDWNNPSIARWGPGTTDIDPEYKEMRAFVQDYKSRTPAEAENFLNYDLKGFIKYFVNTGPDFGFGFKEFARMCTLETRDQANDPIYNTFDVYSRFNLGLNWIKQHIIFIDGVKNDVFK